MKILLQEYKNNKNNENITSTKQNETESKESTFTITTQALTNFTCLKRKKKWTQAIKNENFHYDNAKMRKKRKKLKLLLTFL